MHIASFNAIKALRNDKRIELCQFRLTSNETNISIRLNAFFSKKDVKCAKTRYFALKTRFVHITSLNAMKALGNVQTH